MNPIIQYVPILAIIAIFYFLLFLPERRRRKKLQEIVANLKIGDRVITTAGIHGTVLSLRGETMVVRSDTSKLELTRSSVAALREGPESTGS
ncbi:MAG: preprotein translocase subunit YajC [Acidobacteria bacterium]|nr:preprotein translocase subunit YajC [Acidobacteriota bacterium]